MSCNSWPKRQQRRSWTQGHNSCPDLKATTGGLRIRRRTSNGPDLGSGRTHPASNGLDHCPDRPQSGQRKPDEVELSPLQKKARTDLGPSSVSNRGPDTDVTKEVPVHKGQDHASAGPSRPTLSGQSSSSRRILKAKRRLSDKTDAGDQERPATTDPTTRDQPVISPMCRTELLKKYKFTERIGKGGFGVVCGGVRREDDLPVALKLMESTMVSCRFMELDGVVQRVPDELYFLSLAGAGSDTPGLNQRVSPRILDWFKDGSRVGFVMDRPEPCCDLFQFTRKGSDTPTLKRIFGQLVDKAMVMEHKGIFHRDIKPGNVLVGQGTDPPTAWFIDFGFAVAFREERVYTAPQGTASYASPEWFRSRRYKAGPATVWQLGATLYRALFRTGVRTDLASMESSDPVSIPRNTPADCRDLLLGCLDKNPDSRLTLEQIRNHPWLRS